LLLHAPSRDDERHPGTQQGTRNARWSFARFFICVTFVERDQSSIADVSMLTLIGRLAAMSSGRGNWQVTGGKPLDLRANRVHSRADGLTNTGLRIATA
jgi:hypothetical protein